MFSNRKSYFFLIPFVVMVMIFLAIIFSNFFIKSEKKHSEIEKNTVINIGNREFILKDIIKTKENIFLEFVEEDWLNNDDVMNIKSNFDSEKELTNDVVKIRFKGFYFLKIPVKKNNKILNLIFQEKDKNYKLFIDIKNYKEEEYLEKNVKDYKVDYLDFCIKLNNEKIEKIDEQINEKYNEINIKEKNIEELNSQTEFQIGDELNNAKQKIQNVKNIIENLKDEILNMTNNIVTLKNKNLMLNAEIKFIQTGKKEDVVLISKKDKNGNKIDDLDAKEIYKKEEEREKKEEENKQNNNKKEEEENNKNSSSNNNKNKSKLIQKHNNSTINNNKKNETKVQKNNQNNTSNSDVKVNKNDKKNKEVEVEFVP